MFGLSSAECAQMVREVEADDGPDDEIVPIGPLMARFIIGGVRAGDTRAMKWLDEILAENGVSRPVRKARIHQLKAAGPAPDPEAVTAAAFLKFLRGLQ